MIKEYPMANLIKERRTIRKFKQDDVQIELLTELLEVASWLQIIN